MCWKTQKKERIGMEGVQLNIIKNIHGKPTPNIILNVKKKQKQVKK